MFDVLENMLFRREFDEKIDTTVSAIWSYPQQPLSLALHTDCSVSTQNQLFAILLHFRMFCFIA